MAKTLTGVVVSDKTDKTIVIMISTHKNHPIYKKAYKVTKKFMAHDENNEAKPGDTVIISETKPLSRRKRHTLTKIVQRAAISQDMTVDAITAEPAEEIARKKAEAAAKKAARLEKEAEATEEKA